MREKEREKERECLCENGIFLYNWISISHIHVCFHLVLSLVSYAIVEVVEQDFDFTDIAMRR